MENLKEDFLSKIDIEIENKNILLLQGPMGNFFNEIEKILVNKNANVKRIGLNFADEWFVNKNKIYEGFFGVLPNAFKRKKKENYKGFNGKPEGWDKFIQNYLKEKEIDILITFGDCRYYQSKAIEYMKKSQKKVYVFEEGYIRPNYITLEENGVNANTTLKPLDLIKEKENKKQTTTQFKHTYFHMLKKSVVYYILGFLGSYKYPHYIHHRSFNPFYELYSGIKNIYKKIINPIKEKQLNYKIIKEIKKEYFFLPLQTYNDFQIITHSKYDSIEDYINEILITFKKNENKTTLIFKHHPMDRGKKDYTKHIKKKVKEYNIENEVYICTEIPIRRLIKNAKGTILINSTVGFEVLKKKKPLICMGEANYNIQEMIVNQKLENFIQNPLSPNGEKVKNYLKNIKEETQINSNFYIY